MGSVSEKGPLFHLSAEKLGGGSTDVVCKAEDTKLKHNIAIKFPPEQIPKGCCALERFQREVLTVRRVSQFVDRASSSGGRDFAVKARKL